MRTVISFLIWVLLLSSCSSPPRPPTVDESRKRPVNSQVAVELQGCKNDLHNTRIMATASGRPVVSTAATLANLAARHQMLAKPKAAADHPAQANSTFTVPF